MNRKIASLFIAALVSCYPAFGQAQLLPAGEERLAVLRALKINDATITLVERDAAASRTIVRLVLNPAKSSNINVEVSLPDAEKWNARFLGLGNGGAAGKINPGSLAGPSAAGYAVATTDMGTAPNPDSGVGNREVWKDFGFRATHLMTVTAKQIVRTYYGKEPKLSYFSRGSTGGQQALQEAQRYPEDYDGIAADVPAHCRTPLHAYFLWNDQILKKCPFTKEQDASIIAATNEFMAAREIPAAAGKFVSDPRCTAKDIVAVIALAAEKGRDADRRTRHGAAQTLRRTAPRRDRRTHLQRHSAGQLHRRRPRAPVSLQVGLRRGQAAGGNQFRRGHRYLYRRARALSQRGESRPERLRKARRQADHDPRHRGFRRALPRVARLLRAGH